MASSNSQSAGSAGKIGQYPIAVTFAGLILAALIGLAVLRHLTGTISVQAGTR